MERMNEILARAANRRTSTRRTPTPAPSATSAATSSSASRRSASRRITPGLAAIQPVAATTPPRPLADADTTQTTQPGADVLGDDRILEMPARPRVGIVQPAAKRPAEIASIRELTSTYAAQIGPRRPGRPALSATAGTSSARSNSKAPAASSANDSTNGMAAQGGRTTRTASAPSVPGVCPRCHGAGYVRLDVPVGNPAFGQAVRCQCKEQQIEERDRSNLRRLSNLDPFRDKTFETFDASLPGMREANDIARHYADDPMGWLLFRGGYGCGKTHLAAAIANVAEQNGVPVVFAIVPDLLDHLRATFAPNSDTAYDTLFEKVREVQLLVLDDFGAENSTPWATEKLFQLINYRYNYRMPTVITTNVRLLAHMDERIRSRLSDLGLVRHVVIEAADFRERHTGRPARGTNRGRPR